MYAYTSVCMDFLVDRTYVRLHVPVSSQWRLQQLRNIIKNQLEQIESAKIHDLRDCHNKKDLINVYTYTLSAAITYTLAIHTFEFIYKFMYFAALAIMLDYLRYGARKRLFAFSI